MNLFHTTMISDRVRYLRAEACRGLIFILTCNLAVVVLLDVAEAGSWGAWLERILGWWR